MSNFRNEFWDNAPGREDIKYAPMLQEYAEKIMKFRELATKCRRSNKPALADFYMQKAAQLETQAKSLADLHHRRGAHE
ncbi:MAG: hypothetical protein AAF226_18710 [Verrucomicrobiota bacterium]